MRLRQQSLISEDNVSFHNYPVIVYNTYLRHNPLIRIDGTYWLLSPTGIRLYKYGRYIFYGTERIKADTLSGYLLIIYALL